MITVKLDADIDLAALQDLCSVRMTKCSRLPLEELFGNMKASGTAADWEKSLKFLTSEWLHDTDYFSIAGLLGDEQAIPERHCRDYLEVIARAHDAISQALELFVDTYNG